MEATISENGRTIYGDGRTPRNGVGDAVKKLEDAGGEEVKNLMADVQDLLGRVAHVADPEIARLRTKVQGGLATAKKALADSSDQIQRSGGAALKAGDVYVRNQPWQAVAIAAGAGLVLGFLVGKR